MELISKSKEWRHLQLHKAEIAKLHVKDLFAADNHRFDKYSIKFHDILFDYSKNLINNDTMPLLLELAKSIGLRHKIEEMFAGEKINSTENRAVLHTALRNRSDEPVYVDSENVMPQIYEVLDHMKEFVESIHNGSWLGGSGLQITDVVNIGIGGSDLGPAMVVEALSAYKVQNLYVHFVSNVDASDIQSLLNGLNPETTLFIIASKTFTTQETITNALTAKNWILKSIPKDKIENHFVALSTNEKACIDFGINPKNMFQFWDWVGGRYSLWSAIGLSIALAIGFDNFEELLAGAYEMDLHFRETPFERNIPVIMALLGIWYANFFDLASHAVIPYDEYLKKFPDFLQQLDMESNGKYIDKNSVKIDYKTGPIVWGTIGTNSQHSFFQLIHQGTQVIPVDFIACINNHNELENHHRILLSNFIAQTEALMKGKSEAEVLAELKAQGLDDKQIKSLVPHKVFTGNRPTNTILIKKLTPSALGKLIAMYEHKVFVMGCIWNINSFDQWGVELGKQLAKEVLKDLESDEKIYSHDSSTNGLINYIKQYKK